MRQYYICEICGNEIEMINDSGQIPVCCGKEMKLVKPNSTDGDIEKHIPSCKIKPEQVKIQIGEMPHPMGDDHYIKWIALETVDENGQKGYYRKELKPNCDPEITFHLCKHEKPVLVTSYCSIHGLWYAII